jgi:hypothetical protein
VHGHVMHSAQDDRHCRRKSSRYGRRDMLLPQMSTGRAIPSPEPISAGDDRTVKASHDGQVLVEVKVPKGVQ